MEYKLETERVVTMSGSAITVPMRSSPAEDAQIQRVRKVLIIILAVCIILSMISLVSAVFGSGTSVQAEGVRRNAPVGQAVVSILFYSFGLFVAHRYSQTGLQVFAWLIIVLLVIVGIVLLLVLISFIFIGSLIATANKDGTNTGAMTGFSMIVVLFFVTSIAAFIFSAIIVHLSFKLARLIEANKRFIAQQI